MATGGCPICPRCHKYITQCSCRNEDSQLTAIIAEFGSVEECVKAARYGRECANQEAWKADYNPTQEDSNGTK
jgi:hypothetical protein